MCLSAKERNPQERWLLSLACLCLALSLASRSMNLTFGLGPNALDFWRGLLLGVSVTINFHVLLLRKRRAHRTPSV